MSMCNIIFTPFFHQVTKGKNLELAAYQCKCMEMNLEDRKNNLIIAILNLFYFSMKIGSMIRRQKYLPSVIKY